MNEARTTSMLQRVPQILAVTANSYGLAFPATGSRKPQAAGGRERSSRKDMDGKPSAQR